LADYVDDHDLFRVGDQHADPSITASLLIIRKTSTFSPSRLLRTPTMRSQPGAASCWRIDSTSTRCILPLCRTARLDVNALERLDDLFDGGLIRLVGFQNLDAISSSAPSILTSTVSDGLREDCQMVNLQRAFCAYTAPRRKRARAAR